MFYFGHEASVLFQI